MKLCVDCKHYKKTWFNDSYCTHPKNIEIDLITGKTMYRWRVETNRGSHDNLCGANGKWWETRQRSKGRLDVILNEEAEKMTGEGLTKEEMKEIVLQSRFTAIEEVLRKLGHTEELRETFNRELQEHLKKKAAKG